MSVLYWFESIRFPFLTTLMEWVTRLGEETVIVVLALLFLWCLDKHEGYYLLTVSFAGLLVNQFLKILCRVPRPWVKDPDFTIVEEAREALLKRPITDIPFGEALPPTRLTEIPGFTAGRMPAWNISVSRKICPSVMEITLVGI